MRNKNAFIPPLLQRLHPRMKERDYLRYMGDPLFTNKTTYVCEECYLKACETSSFAGVEEHPAEK